jgi:hypothetical protein
MNLALLQLWILVYFCSVSAGRAGVGSRFGDGEGMLL